MKNCHQRLLAIDAQDSDGAVLCVSSESARPRQHAPNFSGGKVRLCSKPVHKAFEGVSRQSDCAVIALSGGNLPRHFTSPVAARVRPCAATPETQGQRPLKRCSSKDFQQVVIIPTTTAAFHDEACAVGMLFQE
jgi:hypothetical protein